MEHKPWHWKKRSTEKKIAETNSDDSPTGIGEEMLSNEKEAVTESSLEDLNEKLASFVRESKAKDDHLATHIQEAEEANAARERAEAKAASLKQELDQALQHKEDSNERLTQLNSALKDSIQLLASVREEQDQRIRDAVMNTSLEFEKAQKLLEEKLNEKTKLLNNDLSKGQSQAEEEFNTLMIRLDSVEKENAFLKYEFRMLEKELEVRNEEIAYNRQVADESQKQHSESVKKIVKLEAECQRLPRSSFTKA